MTPTADQQPRLSPLQSLATLLYQWPQLGEILLLAPALLWLLVLYLAPLAVLLLQSFFHLDPFTGLLVRQLTLETYRDLFTRANGDILLRTTVMAALVTLACMILAFPLAYTITRYASARVKGILYLLVLLPLWSNYLIRVYAWKLILAKEGILTWVIGKIHLGRGLERVLDTPIIGGPSLSVSALGIFVGFVYVWLPYMILPIQAALERVPRSLLEASADLGGRPWQTVRHVVLPLAFPGVVAGSVFTFSLTLGDFVVPYTLGNSSYFIGQAVLSFQGTSGNSPLAAAFTVVPMIMMIVYLLGAKRLGAFDQIG
jgi:putative spermidine/putrescine transport system permease protein